MKLASLVIIAALTAAPAVAQTKIGTFGQGTNFFVDKFTRDQEGSTNTVAVEGHLVNQHGQPARYSLQMICSNSGTIFVSFAGKNWDMAVKDRKTKWESQSPAMAGYFSIYDRYCTAKYRKSPMSAADRKAFSEND